MESSEMRHRCWRIGCVIIILALTIFLGASNANVVRPRPLDEDFALADQVVAVTIIDTHAEYVRGNKCARRYKSKTIEKFKPIAPENGSRHHGAGEMLSFGRYGGLEVGKSYLLFFKYVTDPTVVYNEFVTNGAKFGPEKEMIDILMCNGTIPGLSFDQETAWEIKDGFVNIFGLLPESLPKSIYVYDNAVADWYLSSADVFSYLRKIGREMHKWQE
jgi:hypothetical protein